MPVTAPAGSDSPLYCSNKTKALSVNSSISPPAAAAQNNCHDTVRTPHWRTAEAAASPTNPIIPTIPTTLAAKNAASVKAASRIRPTAIPKALACVSPKAITDNGRTNSHAAAPAASSRHSNAAVSSQPSCTSEPLPHNITPRVSSL